MIKLIKRIFATTPKQLEIKIKELDLMLTNAKNRDFKHIEEVANELMRIDKNTKNALTILYICTYSSLSAERILNLRESIDMNHPLIINNAMYLANKGYGDAKIISEVRHNLKGFKN